MNYYTFYIYAAYSEHLSECLRESRYLFQAILRKHRENTWSFLRKRASGFKYHEEKTAIITSTVLTKAEWTLHTSHSCIWRPSSTCSFTEPRWREGTPIDLVLVMKRYETKKGNYTPKLFCSSLGSYIITTIFRLCKFYVTHEAASHWMLTKPHWYNENTRVREAPIDGTISLNYLYGWNQASRHECIL